jgi:hypothetical protein
VPFRVNIAARAQAQAEPGSVVVIIAKLELEAEDARHAVQTLFAARTFLASNSEQKPDSKNEN